MRRLPRASRRYPAPAGPWRWADGVRGEAPTTPTTLTTPNSHRPKCDFAAIGVWFHSDRTSTEREATPFRRGRCGVDVGRCGRCGVGVGRCGRCGVLVGRCGPCGSLPRPPPPNTTTHNDHTDPHRSHIGHAQMEWPHDRSMSDRCGTTAIAGVSSRRLSSNHVR